MERQIVRGNRTRWDSPSSPRCPEVPTKFQACEKSVTLPVVPCAASVSGTDVSEIPIGDGVVPRVAVSRLNTELTLLGEFEGHSWGRSFTTLHTEIFPF